MVAAGGDTPTLDTTRDTARRAHIGGGRGTYRVISLGLTDTF
jgi:hypothetical protein